jgi:hypothetical protein
MTMPPDFAAMLDSITEQAGTPVAEPTADTAAAATASISAGGSATTNGVVSVIATDAASSVAAAAATACMGMADRRLVRGDIEGATQWCELADDHD